MGGGRVCKGDGQLRAEGGGRAQSVVICMQIHVGCSALNKNIKLKPVTDVQLQVGQM